MPILMTRLWIRSKGLSFSHVTACGFGPVGPCITYMTHRLEEFRITGRIELQASVGQAGKQTIGGFACRNSRAVIITRY